MLVRYSLKSLKIFENLENLFLALLPLHFCHSLMHIEILRYSDFQCPFNLSSKHSILSPKSHHVPPHTHSHRMLCSLHLICKVGGKKAKDRTVKKVKSLHPSSGRYFGICKEYVFFSFSPLQQRFCLPNNTFTSMYFPEPFFVYFFSSGFT